MIRGWALLIVTALAVLGLAGCAEQPRSPAVLHIESGYIALAATPERPSAGYFTMRGGESPMALVAVTTDHAEHIEMHTVVKENGMVMMKPIARIDVPAEGVLAFAPRGKHLMIWNISESALAAGKLPLVFTFEEEEGQIREQLRFVLPIRK